MDSPRNTYAINGASTSTTPPPAMVREQNILHPLPNANAQLVLSSDDELRAIMEQILNETAIEVNFESMQYRDQRMFQSIAELCLRHVDQLRNVITNGIVSHMAGIDMEFTFEFTEFDLAEIQRARDDIIQYESSQTQNDTTQ